MSNLQHSWQTEPVVQQDELFRSLLASVGVIDVGYIKDVVDEGKKAVVQVRTEELVCEIVSVGSFNNTLLQAQIGQLALVLYPRTAVMLETSEMQLNSNVFNPFFAKCLPIGLGGSPKVCLGSSDTSLSISSDTYRMSFQQGSVSIRNKEFGVTADMQEKQARIVAGNDVQVVVDREGVQVWTGVETDTNTGEITGQKLRLEISREGDVVVETQGSVKMNAGEGFDLEGDVKISGGLEVEKDTKLAGKLDVEQDTKLVGKLDVGEGKLTVE